MRNYVRNYVVKEWQEEREMLSGDYVGNYVVLIARQGTDIKCLIS